MQQHYGAKWKTQSKLKLREMSDADARYILFHDLTPTLAAGRDRTQTGREEQPASDAAGEQVEGRRDGGGDGEGAGKVLAGAVQVRFVEEEELPVLYVYELQLRGGYQGKGVGRFVMQLLELVARKVRNP